MRTLPLLLLCGCTLPSPPERDLPAAGFRRLWNGADLQGWHGQRHFDPKLLAAMPAADLAKFRA